MPAGNPDTNPAPSKQRISSALGAKNIIKGMIKMDVRRAEQRTRVQGMEDGNPPWNGKKLKDTGQGDRTNLNFREGKNTLARHKAQYHSLVMDVRSLVTATCNRNPNIPHRVREHYGNIVNRNLHSLLWEWEDFFFHTLRHQDEMSLHGIGFVYWPDPVGWQFRSGSIDNLYFPKDTVGTQGEYEMCAIRRRMKASDLFRLIRDDEAKDAAKSMGWDIGLIEDLLAKSHKDNAKEKDSAVAWSRVQKAMQAGDLDCNTNTEEIDVAYLFVKEWSGKITQYMIAEGLPHSAETNFLCKSPNRYNKWSECIRVFYSNVGKGTHHSVRGKGTEIFPANMVNDRFSCMAVDGATTAASIVLAPSGTGDKSKPSLIRTGGMTLLPRGYTPEQKQVVGDLGSVLGIRGIMQGIISKNINETDVQGQGGGTMGEYQMRAGQAANLSRIESSYYYRHLDRMYTEVFRRLVNDETYIAGDPGFEEREEFLALCEMEGVPREFLDPANWTIKATRSLGLGSEQMRMQITNDLVSIAPWFNAAGQHNAVYDYAAARTGYDLVERYIQEQQLDEIPTKEHNWASMENHMLMRGDDVVVGVEQDDEIHAKVHMNMLAGEVQSYMQPGASEGLDKRKLFVTLDTTLRHTAEHMQKMQGNPLKARVYPEIEQMFQQLIEVYQKVGKDAQDRSRQEVQVAQADQARMGQQAQDDKYADIQKDLAKIEADFALKATKEQNSQSIRQQKTDNMIKLKERMAEHTMELNERKSGQDENT